MHSKANHDYCNYKALHDTLKFIVANKNLTGSAKLVALVLAKRVQPEDTRCWPSIKTISLDTGLSHVAVIRATKELVKEGYLRKQTGHNNIGNTRYYLNWLDPENWGKFR